MRIKRLFLLLYSALTFGTLRLYAQQDAPNDVNAVASTGNSAAAAKWASTPVNLYTGMPAISIPIFQYGQQNGLNLSVSIDYFSGGVKVNESPTPVGENWYLNAGGVITRTVRGMPDDLYPNGYLYTTALPDNPATNAYNYYHDSTDAELDVFQFNFNGRVGKFFIGKNKQVMIVPLSKMKISYDTASGGISTFRVTTEDGVKYIFSDCESGYITNNLFKSGYNGIYFNRAWYLTRIIAPFNTDTISFNYNSINEYNQFVAFPQTVYVKFNDGDASQRYTPTGSVNFNVKKIASIVFPDKKKITFLYDRFRKYDEFDSVLNRIKISDSIFRYGYLLNWECCKGNIVQNKRAFLGGIRYFTSTATLPAYQFTYKDTLFPAYGSLGDTLSNERDHWGYFNGAANGTNVIPSISGTYSGANREPSATAALAGSLNSVTDPSGGVTYYSFESNDLPQYTVSPQFVIINGLNNTQNTITLSQAFGNQYVFNIGYDVIYLQQNVISGNCDFTISVTSLDGTVTYGSLTTTLYKLASNVSFTFLAPNGTYLLKTTTAGCSSGLTSLPLDIYWQNQNIVGNSMISGGIRLRQQIHFDPVTGHTDTIATYKYILPDGKSSGFLGAVPIYSYPYEQGGIDYTAISSDPVNELTYTQGSPVGYSRVEVIKGTPSHNLGKEVHEFTDLKDVNATLMSSFFPYAPLPQRDWLLGRSKKISVYDSTGHLVKATLNNYHDSIFLNATSSFLSRKYGKVSSNGAIENFTSIDYYPETGHSFLTSISDTTYYKDSSVYTLAQSFVYDSNYNVVKVVSPYDPVRGLSLEKRLYYPYNYTVSGAIGKLRDSSIFTTAISSESWIIGDGNPRMVGAKITDYQQLPMGHIKPLAIFGLQSNHPVSETTIGAFAADRLVRDSTYLVRQKQFMGYDDVGNLTEVRNSLSGQYNSIILDYFHQFPVAQVTNGRLSDIAYTSFESDGTGNWNIGSTAREYSGALTGKLCYQMSNGDITKTGLDVSKTYLITMWCKPGAFIYANGTGFTSIRQHNGWLMYQVTLTGVTSITISGTGFMDELRLYPIEANMATATFEPLVGITSACDASNMVRYYNYDNLNRLKIVKDEDLNVVKKYEYSDSTTLISLGPTWQSAGLTQCATPRNGNVDRQEKDINPYSESYNTTRWVYDHQDCTTCVPDCGTDPSYTAIGCNCEQGTKKYISTVYTQYSGTVYKWKSIYRYCWSLNIPNAPTYVDWLDSRPTVGRCEF